LVRVNYIVFITLRYDLLEKLKQKKNRKSGSKMQRLKFRNVISKFQSSIWSTQNSKNELMKLRINLRSTKIRIETLWKDLDSRFTLIKMRSTTERLKSRSSTMSLIAKSILWNSHQCKMKFKSQKCKRERKLLLRKINKLLILKIKMSNFEKKLID